MKAYSIGFSLEFVESIEKTVVAKLSDALWYLDSHHEKFKDCHMVIPIPFTKYQGFNDYRKNHKSKPYIQATELHAHIGSLISTLCMPWILKTKNSQFRRSVSTVVEFMNSYHDFLFGMQQCTADNHSRKEHFEESFGYRETNGEKGPVSTNYLPPQNELLSKSSYRA